MAVISTFLAVILLLFSSLGWATSLTHALCKDSSNYTCYTVKRGDSWNRLFRDAEQRDLVMRVNRMNTPIYRGMQIAIPKNLNANPLSFSPLPHQINAPGEKIIMVSINSNVLAWGAYDAQGALQKWGPISSARGYCPDTGHGCHTPVGTFAVYNSEGAGCKSSKFPIGHGGAPMPYCMFFHGGFALHGSYEVPGYNASHGCVRMFVPDAQWLNQEFVVGGHVPVIINNHNYSTSTANE